MIFLVKSEFFRKVRKFRTLPKSWYFAEIFILYEYQNQVSSRSAKWFSWSSRSDRQKDKHTNISNRGKLKPPLIFYQKIEKLDDF